MTEMQDDRIAQKQNSLVHEATYHIGKTVFIVQPVFKEAGHETLGEVLLKFMQSEMEAP